MVVRASCGTSFSDSFSPKARRAVFRANAKALKEGAPEITAEHILYGLLGEDPQLFALVAPDRPNLVNEITQSLAADMNVSQAQKRKEALQLSDRAKEVIRVAAREHERLGHPAVGTQHVLLALLICPEIRRSRFRKAGPQDHSAARQALTNCGLLAEAVEAATKDGLVTPQDYKLDDPLIRLNAQLAALAELLIANGTFTRTEYVALLDQNAGPITSAEYVLPLIDALVEKGKLTQDEKATLRAGQPPAALVDKKPEQS
ncbi:MAG: Clp protease N-terminal domain-containing protein [Candidatus Acidiferrales bacterium]